MGLFRREKRPTSSRQNVAEANELVMEILSGQSFSMAIRRGELPPPGHTFLNRFLHGIASTWTEDFLESPVSSASDDEFHASLTGIRAGFEIVSSTGASVPELAGVEEAVTLHLTRVAVDEAGAVIAAQPDLGRVGSDASTYRPGWDPDLAADSVAFVLRDEASSLDAYIATARPSLATAPGKCFDICLNLLERTRSDLSAAGLAHPRYRSEPPMAKHMRLSLSARDAVDAVVGRAT